MNYPNCEVKYEEKPQLTEIEDAFGDKLFRCGKCKTIFELKESDKE